VNPAATVDGLRATVTVATGTGDTVTVANPVLPSTVAVMFAVPACNAVTTPLELTVATLLFELLQATALPVRRFPLASRAVAVACEV
jgi:hypothetical protein